MGTPESVGGVSSGHLKSFVERAERMMEEIKALREDLKEIFASAKGVGFDVATIKKIIKLRAMSEEQRAEEEALLDIYMAALGMLADTPLGRSAIDRLSKPEAPASPKHDSDAGQPDDAPDQAEEAEAEPEVTREDARQDGAQAARDGKPVTSNPWPANDTRRAAWDEGWCSESGSDGMDLPDAWRRRKPKKGDGSAGHEEGKAA